mgnify:CR=1 FL=1
MFIGCLPLYGIHFLPCFVVARLFRLNRLLTYPASHISFPASAAVAAHRRGAGRPLAAGAPPASLESLSFANLDLKATGIDLARQPGGRRPSSALSFGLFTRPADAARPYRTRPPCSMRRPAATADTGLLHWEFVRGKLRYDPLYSTCCVTGILPVPRQPRRPRLRARHPLRPASPRRGRRARVRRGGRSRKGGGRCTHHEAASASERAVKTAEAARHAPGRTGRPSRPPDLTRAVRLPPGDAVLLLDALHYLPAGRPAELVPRLPAAALRPGG